MGRRDPAWNLLAKFKLRDISPYSPALGSSVVMAETAASGKPLVSIHIVVRNVKCAEEV